MTGISFEPATKRDAEAIADLEFEHRNLVRNMDSLEDYLALTNVFAAKAMYHDKLIAFLFAHLCYQSRIVEVDDVFVSPLHRRKRIATRLFQRIQVISSAHNLTASVKAHDSNIDFHLFLKAIHWKATKVLDDGSYLFHAPPSVKKQLPAL